MQGLKKVQFVLIIIELSKIKSIKSLKIIEYFQNNREDNSIIIFTQHIRFFILRNATHFVPKKQPGHERVTVHMKSNEILWNLW